MNADRTQLRRIGLVAGGLVVVAVLAFVLLRGGDSYSVHARMVDASQLVTGGLVEVGGRPIGTVGEISLSDDGQADVELKITDDRYDPLRIGTVARVRTVGLSGVANRYVDITAAQRGAEIPDGGVLPARDTRPVVDLDQVLNDLDPPTRKRLQRIIANGSKIYGGDGTDANRVLAYLNPALAQTRAVSDELTRDAAAVDRLITSASQVLGVLSRRRDDVEGAVVNTAQTMRALASSRQALQSSIGRAPAVLDQAQGTLTRLEGTLAEVRPVIRELRPSAAPLAATLRATVPAARAVDPVARRLRGLLPELREGLAGLPKLERDAIPALRSTADAVRDAMPIFAGLRPYLPDVIGGLFQGLAGVASASYDANGHYARITPTVGANGAAGLLSLLGSLPDLGGYSKGNIRRCAGAATQPASDGSNPFVDDPGQCDRAHGIGAPK